MSILNFKKWLVRGEPVAVITPAIRVDAVILRYAVMECQISGEGEPTRSSISRLVRERAKQRGQDGLYYWSDEFSGGDEDEADEIARTLFPEAFK